MADALYNNSRRIYAGNVKSFRKPATVASVIYAGDFLVVASNKASQASELGDSGTLAQNQAALKAVFLGIALDGKAAGVTKDVLIAGGGALCEYPCAAVSGAHYVGEYVGVAGTGAANAVGMADQIVVIVADSAHAIGRLVEDVADGATKLKFELAAALSTPFAGPQTIT